MSSGLILIRPTLVHSLTGAEAFCPNGQFAQRLLLRVMNVAFAMSAARPLCLQERPLDHLVSASAQRRRHVEAKRLGGLEVDCAPALHAAAANRHTRASRSLD